MCFPSRRGNEQEVIVVMRPDKRACVPASLMLITHHTRAAAVEEVHSTIATAQERRIHSKAYKMSQVQFGTKQGWEFTRLKHFNIVVKWVFLNSCSKLVVK